MSEKMPALSLVAIPGRRKAMLEMATEIEKRGFAGIYCPSMTDCLALCEALAFVTEKIPFGTAIAPIYSRHINEYAQMAAFIHEISDGRFRFGVGVSHGPVLKRLGVSAGKPLGDMRNFVDGLRAVPRTGDQPPVILATLRKKMIALAGEIGDGMVFANGARSHMASSLSALPDDKRNDENFFIGNMIPTCVSDDVEAAKAVNRRTLTGYAMMPNYRNYWREAGYEEEMAAVEKVIADGEPKRIGECLSDKWLADTTISGPPAFVRDQIAEWFDAGIRTPIIVPSSAVGNQLDAFKEFFNCYK